MFLNLYEQPSPDVMGDSAVQARSQTAVPDRLVIDVADGPAYLTDDQVARLIYFLVTWRRLTPDERDPVNSVYSAGR